MISGSDTRSELSPAGLNGYGCGAAPRNALPLGSCTCSSPSPRGIDAAARILERLRRAPCLWSEAELLYERYRRRLRRLLELASDTDVAFAPSGTDLELLALALVDPGHGRRIVNVVVGPTEVGSGTPCAAAGLHYDDLVPSGREVRRGAPVCPRLAERVDVEFVEIRNHRGEMLHEAEIDAAVTEIVARAAESGAHVLLHVVAHSKTGMHAPSLACAERIRRHLRDDVTILIDAAQGRVSRRGLRDALGRGYLVLFTGSKFYGGPPFSGALLVPAGFRGCAVNAPALPGGFDEYFTTSEMPPSWARYRSQLSDRVNAGGLLRWAAALAEMDAYYDVSSAARLAVLRSFEEAVPQIFAGSDSLRLLAVFPPIHDDARARLLESKTTVFGFRVETDSGCWGRDALKAMHRALNGADRSANVARQGGTSARNYHLGQPVAFRDGSAALRIALGGELIVRVARDTSLGCSLESRLEWLRGELTQLRQQAEQFAAAFGNDGELLPEGVNRSLPIR